MKSYLQLLKNIRKIPNFLQWMPLCSCSKIKIKQHFICHPPDIMDMCSVGILTLSKNLDNNP